MAYKYDIFISYRRDPEARMWINNHFEPLLKSRLKLELGNEPHIFIDDQIEAGTMWPAQLANSISSSRVLIPLWTKTFLSSKWCTCELAHMLEREKKSNRAANGLGYSLIIPMIVHDGDTLPEELSAIQVVDLKSCYNSRMGLNSPRAEELDDKLSMIAEAIANAIKNAPPFEADWKIEAENKFFETFYLSNAPVQAEIPKYTI